MSGSRILLAGPHAEVLTTDGRVVHSLRGTPIDAARRVEVADWQVVADLPELLVPVTGAEAEVGFVGGERPAGIVIGIGRHGEADLLEVVQAGSGSSSVTRLRQRGQQHRSEDRNDGNDDKQFDERKRSSNLPSPRLRLASDKQFYERKATAAGAWTAAWVWHVKYSLVAVYHSISVAVVLRITRRERRRSMS
jgi:hypothetical protein